MGGLEVAVEQQVFDKRQPHAEHPLTDSKAVRAGGVGDGAVLRQHAGSQIRVRPGKVGLEPFEMMVLPDELDRDVAQDGISPQDFFERGSFLRGKAVNKRRHRIAQALLQGVGQG